ncbi:MAG TPA: RNA polymerase sigma factor [Pseudoneobacillus sp.]|nr:RNA polymerase sigma factor [Pseudoneobacillus sp.]
MSNTRISEWFNLYSNDIYQFLIYFIGSSDVEDLVQEVFIRAIKNVDNFEEKSSPKTWLISIARHVGIDEIRRKQRLRVKNLIFMDSQAISQFQTPEDFLNLNETKKDLYKAIRKLKTNYREVIILRGIKELTIEETAEILNWKEEKVRLTFHRAIKALQKGKEGFL